MPPRPAMPQPGTRPRPRPAALIAAGALALAGLTACSDATGVACTQIGCLDGLRVHVAGPPGSEFAVEVSAAGGEARTGTCTVQRDQCVVFFETTAEEMTLRIVGPDGELTRTVKPVYEISRPNGPRCPPICRNATIVIDEWRASGDFVRTALA